MNFLGEEVVNKIICHMLSKSKNYLEYIQKRQHYFNKKSPSSMSYRYR